ncbi:MAG: hypothetical protein K2X70_05515 [Candidatus Obscuribacterales bacterium]|nr:hypothetical protein [Candidatus Obscuribacterales bacterium]
MFISQGLLFTNLNQARQAYLKPEPTGLVDHIDTLSRLEHNRIEQLLVARQANVRAELDKSYTRLHPLEAKLAQKFLHRN